MLVRLSIRNIVLIEALDLSFRGGFTALTGETGAGKSILLDALSLVLGAKADGKLVRKGSNNGQVTAAFAVPSTHAAVALLDETGFAAEDEIIIRRSLTADGRARGFVNDQAASVGFLRALGALLVEVHGQHADRSLLHASSHRDLVDAFGALSAERADVSRAWQDLKSAEAALSTHETELALKREEADYLRASVEELTALDPEPGEEERLSAGRQTMAAAEKVASDLAEAMGGLEGPRSPIPTLAGLLRKLERKAAGAEDVLTPVMEALARALDTLEDARTVISDAQRSLDFDPHELEGVEERLFALRAASRKFKVPADELPALATQMADDLAGINAGEATVAALASEVAAAERRYTAAANTLSETRRAAAAALEKAVSVELAPLKLDKARFSVDCKTVPPGSEGVDRLEFVVQTNPGSPPGPIMKVASGGELSRFLLALRVCLADKGAASTLIFDEIDTGVGGAVSDAIGARMARLGTAVQVLSVTHAPQVAARAGSHLLISKSHTDEGTATRVTAIEGHARREEIARMLAGAVITDEARAAATRLIEA